MALGLPWSTLPSAWSLDGWTFRTIEPETPTLVRSLVVGDSVGLWATLACTAPTDHWKLYTRVLAAPEFPLWMETLDLVADALVERVTGWKRWQAEYVWNQALSVWPAIDGDHRANGVDLLALPPHAATNTAFAWFRRNLGGEEDWKKFKREMEREPTRVLAAKADEGMDADQFKQLQAFASGGAT